VQGREELSLLPERAPPEKVLARRPQSKAPHALAGLRIDIKRRMGMDARSGGLIRVIPRRTVTERVGKNDLCSRAADLPAVTARLWVKRLSWQTQGRWVK
jgi:hypothetical protein